MACPTGPSGECCAKCYFMVLSQLHEGVSREDAAEIEYKSEGYCGFCVRYAPLRSRHVDDQFPEAVEPDDWCGEFKRHPECHELKL